MSIIDEACLPRDNPIAEQEANFMSIYDTQYYKPVLWSDFNLSGNAVKMHNLDLKSMMCIERK
jgi:hypothetical protein